MTEYNEWQEFFNNHAPYYMEEVFVKNTEAEVEFIVEELGLPSGSRILDMGCGTGRHSIGLAARGYRMTGVDWSSGMLAQAQKDASRAGVEIEWVCENAQKFKSDTQFDAAICLCEGAFGLLLKDEDPVAHDYTILKNIQAALKPGAKLILGALNGLAKIRAAKKADIASGRFDPFTLIERFTLAYKKPEGEMVELILHEHGFLPMELLNLCREAGFDTEHLWGGTAGNWRRDLFDLDEIELMVIARKL